MEDTAVSLEAPVAEAPVIAGRDAELAAEILREAFRPFELGRGPARAKTDDPSRGQIVGDALHERRFRPHDDEVDGVLAAKANDRRMILDVDRRDRGDGGAAGIARGDEQAPQPGRFRRRERQRVLASAGAENQEVHSDPS